MYSGYPIVGTSTTTEYLTSTVPCSSCAGGVSLTTVPVTSAVPVSSGAAGAAQTTPAAPLSYGVSSVASNPPYPVPSSQGVYFGHPGVAGAGTGTGTIGARPTAYGGGKYAQQSGPSSSSMPLYTGAASSIAATGGWTFAAAVMVSFVGMIVL